MSTLALSAGTSCQVRVGVRIRPLTSKEESQGGKQVVEANRRDCTVGITTRKFTYDAVFDENVSQPELYETVADSLLGAFLDGYNSTIMAYGQTGSGKTFSMGSEAHGGLVSTSEDMSSAGLIPRFMSDIFSNLEGQKMRSDAAASRKSCSGEESEDSLIDFQVTASFLEVYGEDVHDLLDEDRKPLPLREDVNGSVTAVGLRTVKVSNASDALNVLNIGTMHRTTAATLMNHTSSRSHAVFTVNLYRTSKGSGETDITTSSRFTFVDLAGSERLKKTGAEGERAREGIKINEGLLALGIVINALADDNRLAKGEKVHVPYRQSKLTRLLQDALGGNSQTLFLACVSPSDTNASETLSTLHYANRARNIKNAPTKNVDGTILELQRLHKLTDVLQCELIKQRFARTFSSEDSHQTQLLLENGKSENDIGEASEELFKRKDVQEYLGRIHKKVEEQSGQSSTIQKLSRSSRNDDIPGIPLLVSSSSSLSSTNRPTSNPTDSGAAQLDLILDDSALLDANPDEDLAILDQLLDLQHHDQEYNQEQKKDKEQLEKVEGELQEQEALLLQLKENLKLYHTMKAKYEILMGEVQSLEAEKISLATQLENAQIDPTKGCSTAIKKKLEKVESSLKWARSETRKHQQMYRKAEQEAQKSKMLERKITELKHGKVALIKRQKEAASRHRAFTETKSKEIQTLKRKERKTGKQVSKLAAECNKHKMTIDRRNEYCNKLSDKLKQTESHLMRLLAMKKRDMNSRTRQSQNQKPNANKVKSSSESDKNNGFAETTREMASIKFLLENMVSDRVNRDQMKVDYEEKVAEYSELMRSLVKEMKELNIVKDSDEENNEENSESIKEREQNIEDIEIKLELVGSDLEELRTKLPDIVRSESDDTDVAEETKSEESARKMIANLSAPVIRSLLWDFLDYYTKSEFERKVLDTSVKRKESALESLELEIEDLNNQIVVFSNDLNHRRRLSAQKEDNLTKIQKLEEEVALLDDKGIEALRKFDQSQNEVMECKRQMSDIEKDLSTAKEKLTLTETFMKKSEAQHETEMTLISIQNTWEKLGTSLEDRESVRQQIETCIEDTCARKLEDATKKVEFMTRDIEHQRNCLVSVYNALGRSDTAQETIQIAPHLYENQTLLQHSKTLREKMELVRPTYDSAVERKLKITSEVEALVKAMHPMEDELSTNLQTLLKQKRPTNKRKRVTRSMARPNLASAKERRAQIFKDVEGMVKALDSLEGGNMVISENTDMDNEIDMHIPIERDTPIEIDLIDNDDIEAPNTLSVKFLDDCEKDTKLLRMMKSMKLVANASARDHAQGLAREMHLTSVDIMELVTELLEKRLKHIPRWWSLQVADEVGRCITTANGHVGVNNIFTKHLEIIAQSLEDISESRRALSETMKSVVETAHKTLLTTVEGEINASEAYASFHEALFRLPPLSSDHMKACIDELNVLITAAEAMTQSEIEALTVVWEALNVGSNERGQFWSEADQSITSLQTKAENPFDYVLKSCTGETEAWLISSIKDATALYRVLSVRLFKLCKIHDEVEKQRQKQDTKSKIMSLDSEIRVLCAKLAEFEETASGKQRLTTKKVNSAHLLKEEKFRKQMQGRFASRLENLGKLLKEWEVQERSRFDTKMLSEEVTRMLRNPNDIEQWVENRTAFMHFDLKTGSKRRLDDNSSRKMMYSNSPQRRGRADVKRSENENPQRKGKSTRSPLRDRSKSRTPSSNGSVSSSRSTTSSKKNTIGRRPLTNSSFPRPPRLNTQTRNENVDEEISPFSSQIKPVTMGKREEGKIEVGPFGHILSSTPKEGGENVMFS